MPSVTPVPILLRYSILLEERPPSAAEDIAPSLPPPYEQPSEQDPLEEASDVVPSTSGRGTRQTSSSDAGWWKRWSSIVVGGQMGTSTHWARQLAQESLGRLGITSTGEATRLMNRVRERLRRDLIKLWQKAQEHQDVLLILVAMAW